MRFIEGRVAADDAAWQIHLGLAATVLLVFGHGAHDLMVGSSWPQAVWPGVVLLAQNLALTAAYRWIPRPWAFYAAGAAISAVCGLVFGAFHGEGALPHLDAGGVLIGFAIWGFWALAFRLPGVLYEARLRGLEMEGLKREAELARIRSSLQPHFVLNTLNTISALVVDEPAVARRLLVALGDLLRDAVDLGPEARPLAEDVAWLRRYTEIIEVRHDTVRFEWDIDEEALDALLPKLLLQPLVENAVKHGALRRGEGGVVVIRARRVGEGLRLVVEDNGPGFPQGTAWGLGLELVRERLAIARPGATLALEATAGGTRATIDVPVGKGA